MVPLAEAWDSGASAWRAKRREAYANDQGQGQEASLIAVTARSNRSKADQDPAQWLPPAADAHCRYAAEWVATKLRWSLTAAEAELTALRVLTGECWLQKRRVRAGCVAAALALRGEFLTRVQVAVQPHTRLARHSRRTVGRRGGPARGEQFLDEKCGLIVARCNVDDGETQLCHVRRAERRRCWLQDWDEMDVAPLLAHRLAGRRAWPS
jgi:hypothetical protein